MVFKTKYFIYHIWNLIKSVFILESENIGAIFQKKRQRNVKRVKYLKIWLKNVQNLIFFFFEKGQVIAYENCTQKLLK